MLLSTTTTSVGDAFDIAKVPHATASSGDIMDLKNGPMQKAGGTLAQLYLNYKRFARKGGELSSFVGKQKQLKQMLMLGNDAGGKPMVAVTLRAFTSVNDLKSMVTSLGGRVLGETASLQSADAYVPIAALGVLAGNSTIAHVNPIMKPQTQRGIATNQGDRLNADRASQRRSAPTARTEGRHPLRQLQPDRGRLPRFDHNR